MWFVCTCPDDIRPGEKTRHKGILHNRRNSSGKEEEDTDCGSEQIFQAGRNKSVFPTLQGKDGKAVLYHPGQDRAAYFYSFRQLSSRIKGRAYPVY
jgi:hypothetical protein